jgi:hypothetical protein
VAKFTHTLSSIGVSWLAPPGAGAFRYGRAFHVLNGELESHDDRPRHHKIQVIWATPTMTAFEFITGFHSTLPQCFVSAFCAVYLYHTLSSQGKMVQWIIDETQGMMRHVNAPACVQKYQDRGYQLIDCQSHETRCHDEMFRALVRCGVERPRVSHVSRIVSDSGCLVVDFTEYYNFASLSEKEIFLQSLNFIKGLRWTEKDGRCVADSASNALQRYDLLARLRIHYEQPLLPPCSWLRDVDDDELPWMAKVAGAGLTIDDPRIQSPV